MKVAETMMALSQGLAFSYTGLQRMCTSGVRRPTICVIRVYPATADAPCGLNESSIGFNSTTSRSDANPRHGRLLVDLHSR
jgi:hypothetical protein